MTVNVGSNVGSSTNFGNVDGAMNDQNGASAAAGADLLTAYGDLSATIPTLFPGTLLGNGITLTTGVYSSPAPTVLSLDFHLRITSKNVAIYPYSLPCRHFLSSDLMRLSFKRFSFTAFGTLVAFRSFRTKKQFVINKLNFSSAIFLFFNCVRSVCETTCRIPSELILLASFA